MINFIKTIIKLKDNLYFLKNINFPLKEKKRKKETKGNKLQLNLVITPFLPSNSSSLSPNLLSSLTDPPL